MADARNTFSDNLKYALDVRGVSQLELAEKTGVSTATASYWCNGKAYPRPDKMQMIADLLHVTMSWLTTGEESDFVKYFSTARMDESSRIAQQIEALDEHGRSVVLQVLKLEMERMENEKA